MTEHEVVIVGAGPTGLMLAGELALAGIDVALLDKRADQELAGLRAGGLQMRTLELLDQRGIVERFLAQGQPFRATPFAGTTLDVADTPTRHNYFLALWQTHIERTLAEWVRELKVPIRRSDEVKDFAQHERGVEVSLADGATLRAKYLVGCDGGRSTVRKRAGIELAGSAATTSYLIAEIETDDEPAWGFHRRGAGFAALAKLDDGARVVLSEAQLAHGEPTEEDLRAALLAAYGTDFSLRRVGYLSRFTDAARQATAYRTGRVLLAGDAAHVHSPMGGQGLNLGLQDAFNLGWKLAQVVRGTSSEALLDSYHSERHPVGARVLRNTRALSALEHGGSDALRAMITEVMQLDQARRHYVAMMSGLDVHYALGEGHPLLGRRMPDLQLETTRVFALLHEARPVLISFAGALDAGRGPLRYVEARYAGAWELPSLGVVPAPSAVLIRPDGYVAWVGDGSDRGLRDALRTWCGDQSA